jgi:chemotaxis protein MotB
VAPRDGAKKIVIVKKKKGHGGGHHGGSWKVAYADFVTAMMAFFMVMWILGMDDSAKKAIEGYFSNPVGYKKGGSSGGASPISNGSSPAAVQQQTLRLIVRNYEERRFSEVGDKLRARLNQQGGLSFGAKVEVVVGNDGLRIELVEGSDGATFFPSGSTALKPAGTLALGLIASELGELTHGVIIEGHTDAAPLARDDGYGNWDLSAGRANTARRVLEASGLPARRVIEVRGLADRSPRVPENPMSPANRRITVLLPFTVMPDGSQARRRSSVPNEG